MLVKKRHSEEELVEHLVSKDQKRFAVLYDYFSPSLSGIIMQIVSSEEITKDLLQETFVKIWNASSTYDVKKSRLFTWVLNIARNTAIDYLRSKEGKKENQTHSLEEHTHSKHAVAEAKNHDYLGVNRVLSDLDDSHRKIIDLAYFEGYTQEEIAKKLDIPLGTVKTKTRAALCKLRTILKA